MKKTVNKAKKNELTQVAHRKLDADALKLVAGGRAKIGFRFPCDGPGRGGTCGP